MPVTYGGGGISSERMYQTLMDWSRRVMQVSLFVTIVLYAYVLYGLFGGDVSQWGSITDAAARDRIVTNITSAVYYLNISLGILLLSSCVLFYDDERFGYILLIGAAAFYYGIPMGFGVAMPDAAATWLKTKNTAALAIYQQFQFAAIMMAVPSGLLVLRDLVMRITGTAASVREMRATMQYGAGAKTEAPPSASIIGMMSKCWQLPYCRDAVRKRCPIYLRRTRCWSHRVGCMCEELVIRGAMDDIINREAIILEKPKEEDGKAYIGGMGTTAAKSEDGGEKTEELPVPGKHIAIPYNKNLPMYAKKERCRNCVIYNEHQRMKYQLFAPLMVLLVPGLAYWQFSSISGVMQGLLGKVDELMAKLSLVANPGSAGVQQAANSSGQFAEYMVIGCLVILGTSLALRFLEHLIFKLKI